jgi:hypothetical protein
MNKSPWFLGLLLLATACGGGGGGGGADPIGPITPPAPVAATAWTSGLVAAAAGAGSVRLDATLPGTGYEAALFTGGSASTVYAGAPLQTVNANVVQLQGLTDGVDVFFGLGVRATGASAWQPAGAVLRVRPGAPIYVDASANATGADGASPATAFPSLLDAMLVAGARNGANVWVRDGDYRAGPFPLGPNVHVAGGFGAAFDLASRDPDGLRTRLLGSTGLQIVDVISGGADASLDGLLVDGENTVTEGIDITDSDVELRSLRVRRCTDRGVRAKVTAATPNRRLQMVACVAVGNAADGLSTAGPIDVRLDQCSFEGNGQEGADLDDLQAPSGGQVALHATACRFYGNLMEGLDADLAAAPLATTAGTFAVLIENCHFEANGQDGLLVDQEHELSPGFVATLVVRGCVARGNAAAGFHVDADAAGTYVLDRLLAAANGGDGVLITSESDAGEVVLTASWLHGNRGHGARAGTGNKVLLASQCAFAGNSLGGLSSAAGRAAAANTVFHGQSAALTGAVGRGNVTPSLATSTFGNVPTAYTTITAQDQGTLTVAAANAFAPGTSVVVAGDGNRRLVASRTGQQLVLDAVPPAFLLPATLAAFAGSDVVADLRLANGSPAVGAGLAPAGASATDCGPHGGNGGGVPGRCEPGTPTPLRLLQTSPALATGVTSVQSFDLVFDRAVDPASVLADRIVVLQDGQPAVVSLQTAGAVVTVAPTGGGFTGTLEVVLHAGLSATDGQPLAGPLVLPMRRL